MAVANTRFKSVLDVKTFFMEEQDVLGVYRQLCTLQEIKNGEKLATSAAGIFSIDTQYLLRGVVRRIRRDGVEVTSNALNTLAVDLMHICICVGATPRPALPTFITGLNWHHACKNAAGAISRLSETYRADGLTRVGQMIARVSDIVRECALRFEDAPINAEPPVQASRISSTHELDDEAAQLQQKIKEEADAWCLNGEAEGGEVLKLQAFPSAGVTAEVVKAEGAEVVKAKGAEVVKAKGAEVVKAEEAEGGETVIIAEEAEQVMIAEGVEVVKAEEAEGGETVKITEEAERVMIAEEAEGGETVIAEQVMIAEGAEVIKANTLLPVKEFTGEGAETLRADRLHPVEEYTGAETSSSKKVVEGATTVQLKAAGIETDTLPLQRLTSPFPSACLPDSAPPNNVPESSSRSPPSPITVMASGAVPATATPRERRLKQIVRKNKNGGEREEIPYFKNVLFSRERAEPMRSNK